MPVWLRPSSGGGRGNPNADCRFEYCLKRTTLICGSAALGLLSPLGSLGIIAAMLVATFTVHLGKGLFTTTGGPELPVINMAVSVAVAIAGPGRYSLDSWLGVSLPDFFKEYKSERVVFGRMARILASESNDKVDIESSVAK